MEEPIRGELLKGHLPMLVLSVIRDCPRHGYEIMKLLAARSEGAFDLGQGTIYPLLYSLEEQDFIASKEQLVEGRRRRVYRLTGTGRKALGIHQAQWLRFAAAVNQVITPVHPEPLRYENI